MNGPDRLIQGMAGGGDFRIIAAQTTETVETARGVLDLAPVAADALGRALTGSLLLARLLDKALKNQYVTLRFEGDESIAAIEARVKEAPPLSTLLAKMPIEEVVATVLHDVDYKQIDPSFDVPLSYTCACSRERALAPLALFSDDELREMMREETTEVVCQFCGRKYHFSQDELLGLTKVN